MKGKANRLEMIKMLISSREMSCQEEILLALQQVGYDITQVTLSRDLKQLKVAKAANINGKYIFVLPNDTLYKRVDKHLPVTDMLSSTGFLSIRFSGNMAVIKTRPGYASSIAFNIDDANLPDILGTVAGADTILMVIKAGKMPEEIIHQLQHVDPSIH